MEQTRQAQAAAAHAGHLLAQRAIRAAGQFAVLSDLADGLLHAQEQVRQEAATMLAGQAALTGPPPYALAVIRPAADPPGPAPGGGEPAPGGAGHPGAGQPWRGRAGRDHHRRRPSRAAPGDPGAARAATGRGDLPLRWRACTPAWLTPSTQPTASKTTITARRICALCPMERGRRQRSREDHSGKSRDHGEGQRG